MAQVSAMDGWRCECEHLSPDDIWAPPLKDTAFSKPPACMKVSTYIFDIRRNYASKAPACMRVKLPLAQSANTENIWCTRDA
jgi:hypothetical protein